ncbi:MAG: type II toxin-antitoxin system VapC family toxin [Hyphomicrobiaceae bacterium]
MARVVLDASAILAVFLHEPGWDAVAEQMREAAISAVNFAEVLSTLSDHKAPDEVVQMARRALQHLVVPFDHAMALRTAELRRATRTRGLSLGDRACLALALTESLPVLTADRQWRDLGLRLDIRVIR